MYLSQIHCLYTKQRVPYKAHSKVCPPMNSARPTVIFPTSTTAIAQACASSADHSRQTTATSQSDDAADTREQNAALSDHSRASRIAKVSIQRHAPLFPPAISADKMSFVQIKRRLCKSPSRSTKFCSKQSVRITVRKRIDHQTNIIT